MQLDYATRDLERVCTDARRMQTTYGANVAKKLKLRLAELTYVDEMADLLAGRVVGRNSRAIARGSGRRG